MAIGNRNIKCYALKRIAGEKLRAYLTSLPAYGAKVNRPNKGIRAKDLYDLTRILGAYPLPEAAGFWTAVVEEFKVCCQSRYIDCSGINSFSEGLTVARDTYEKDPTIPKDVTFDSAWSALVKIIDFIDHSGLFPLVCPLPDDS